MGQCKKCERPLTIMIDWDDEASDPDQAGASSENEVPDSVELQCGCFFHWCVSPITLASAFAQISKPCHGLTLISFDNAGNVY